MTDSNNLPLTYLTCSKVVPSLVSASEDCCASGIEDKPEAVNSSANVAS